MNVSAVSPGLGFDKAVVIASNSFGATGSTTEASPVIGQAPYRAAVLASAPSG